MTENEIKEIIIVCAIKVHKALDHGLLELTFQKCLNYELCKNSLEVDSAVLCIIPKPSELSELCG